MVQLRLADLFSARFMSLAPLGPPCPRPSRPVLPVPCPLAPRRAPGDSLADRGAAPDESRPGSGTPPGTRGGRGARDKPDSPLALRQPRRVPPAAAGVAGPPSRGGGGARRPSQRRDVLCAAPTRGGGGPRGAPRGRS